MELALFAVVLAAVAFVVGRELFHSTRRWPFASAAFSFGIVGCYLLAASLLAAAEGDTKKAAAGRPEGEPAVKKLVRPDGWPKDQPLPQVASNCASCHLTAGRELTAAVVNFVRSAHDMQEMTCYDCHGGNTVDDIKAHYEDFGFIGTKKSAHITTCSECHTEAAEALAAGPHHWDWSERINTEFPMCFDCHGNHDIGNAPADFQLQAWCLDCHESAEKDFPNLLAVVQQNDKLWQTMGQVRRRRIHEEHPIPEDFQDQVAELRGETMLLVHTSQEVTPEKAKELNQQAEELRLGLEKWLQSNPPAGE